MRKLYLTLALCWTIFIAIICLVDLSDIEESKRFNIPHIDKIVHFSIYLIFSFLWGMSFMKKEISYRKNSVILITGSVFFGFVIEMLQAYGGFRSFEWLDLLANSLGVIIGCFLCLKMLKISEKASAK